MSNRLVREQFLVEIEGEEGSKTRKIGWDGKTLKEMLEESENLFEETGRYYGLEKLEFKEQNPLVYERVFALIRGSLVSARETSMNISASPIVQELGELCFTLYNPEGDTIAISTGIITHVRTMSDAIKWMIRNNYEDNPEINPGDIFCNNDVFIGNCHTADVHTIKPIFWKGELVAWAGACIHGLDIGAVVPGTAPVGPTSCYEEGLKAPCEKIGENDTIYKYWEVRCERLIRNPIYWKLDEKSRLAGCDIIRNAVHRIINEIGIDTFKGFIRESIEDGRLSVLEVVNRTMIPGRYRSASFGDVTFKGSKRVPARAAKDTVMHMPMEMTIKPSGNIIIDFDGASKWGYHSFNASPSAVYGGLYSISSEIIWPSDKINAGLSLVFKLKLPYGSILNPESTLPCTVFSWGSFIVGLNGLFRSYSRGYFSRGFIEEVLAGMTVCHNLMSGGGIDHLGQESAMFNFEFASSGLGARAFDDGLDHAFAMFNPESDMGDVEVWEIVEPLLYLGRRVQPNSAGPGKFRGGNGFESVRMLWKTNNFELMWMGVSLFVSGGLFGGYPGAGGYRREIHNNNMMELIKNKEPYPYREFDPENSEIRKYVKGDYVYEKKMIIPPEILFNQGDLYISSVRGGDGYGDILERDPKRVAKDVNDESLLFRFAESIYGVILERDEKTGKWKVNQETEQKRKELREERERKAVPVNEWIEKTKPRILAKEVCEEIKGMYNDSFLVSERWGKEFKEFWGLPEDFLF
ncbi:MAG: hydantoinase B/oxoprolinase family protein [Candidatus Lokiarchaeia archaeon]